MELTKLNYKKTEVGYIPEDWDCKAINDVCNLKHGFQFLDEHFTKNGIGVVKIGNLEDGRGIKEENLTFVSRELAQKLNNFYLNKGDVLMALTGGTLGKVSIVDTDIPLLQNYRVGNFHPNSDLNKGFLHQILTSFYLKNAVKKLVNEAAQPNFGKQDFDKLYIPLPPTLEEQKAIATALSDVDDLITNLDKLITKKKAIKQGAMQQLLTPPHKGGKRLAGFTGEWVEKKLGEVVDYKNGTAHENCVVDDGDYIIVNSKFVSTEGKVVKYSNENRCPVNKDEILMVLSDVPNGKAIAKCYYVEVDNKYTLNQRICSFKTDKVDTKYLFLILNRNPYYLQFDDGVKQTNLRNEDVLKCSLDLPPTKEEQKTIAQILTDMDDEIDQLENKKAKYQNMKQGMMQELLTGKTRLV